ncbi:MAG: amino acid racemase [Gammaproteobacteria bacterium]|nr:amino acid racemase [Gammaproteobacteria bacterium]
MDISSIDISTNIPETMETDTNNEKTIGIIGGLGPEATADFFNRIIRNTPTEKDQDHLHVIIDNNPKAPNRNQAIAGTGPSPFESFKQSALRLKQAGAELLVMPCNTAHAFKDAIIHNVDTPFIDIVEEATAHIAKHYPTIEKAGLLAVDGCLQTRLYHNALAGWEIETQCLDTRAQHDFMELIYQIKASGVNADIKQTMMSFARSLEDNGAEVIIAGCTEVPLVLSPKDLSIPLIDSTEILATQCVRYARQG